MTSRAAPLSKQVATKVQSIGTLCYAIAGVTLLTTCLGVFFFEHRPQPEFVLAVTLQVACGRSAITPATTGTPELIGVMNLQKIAVRMAHKSASHAVRCFSWTMRSEISWF